MQYVFPHPEPTAFQNGTTSVNLMVTQQYTLTQQTRGNWVFALASNAGGTWTTAMGVIIAAVVGH